MNSQAVWSFLPHASCSNWQQYGEKPSKRRIKLGDAFKQFCPGFCHCKEYSQQTRSQRLVFGCYQSWKYYRSVLNSLFQPFVSFSRRLMLVEMGQFPLRSMSVCVRPMGLRYGSKLQIQEVSCGSSLFAVFDTQLYA